MASTRNYGEIAVTVVWLLLSAVFIGLGVPVIVAYTDWTVDNSPCLHLWLYALCWVTTSGILMTVGIIQLCWRSARAINLFRGLVSIATLSFVVWGAIVKHQSPCNDSEYMWTYTQVAFWYNVVLFVILCLIGGGAKGGCGCTIFYSTHGTVIIENTGVEITPPIQEYHSQVPTYPTFAQYPQYPSVPPQFVQPANWQ